MVDGTKKFPPLWFNNIAQSVIIISLHLRTDSTYAGYIPNPLSQISLLQEKKKKGISKRDNSLSPQLNPSVTSRRTGIFRELQKNRIFPRCFSGTRCLDDGGVRNHQQRGYCSRPLDQIASSSPLVYLPRVALRHLPSERYYRQYLSTNGAQ